MATGPRASPDDEAPLNFLSSTAALSAYVLVTRTVRRRAGRVANRLALAATVLMGLYVAYTMPPQPMARLYGAIAVVATYIIVRRVAGRVALETMK